MKKGENMKGKFLVLGLAAILCAGASASLSKTLSYKQETRDTRIIVELDGSLDRNEQKLYNEQNYVLSRIRQEVTNNVEVTNRYVKAFNGFVINVPAKYVTHIRSISGVKDVNYDTAHCIQTTEADLARKNAVVVNSAMSNISAETMNVPENTKKGEGTLIAILDTGFMINATYKDEKGTQHTNVSHSAFTALDDSVQLKYTQESIKAKIDAASKFNGKYDATHSTYFNNKVPFYYDYGGDIIQTGDERPDREVNPDYDVFDEYNDHGNHVASIAAGNDPYYQGIAPKAQLALMKVFTPIIQTTAEGTTSSTGATDVAILSAFEDCITLGVDVVNMSLGSTLNDFSESTIVLNAVKNLQNSGVLCAIAAGNDGKDVFYNSAYEYWTTDMVEPGILGGYASSDATVVGSVQPDKKYYDSAFKVGDSIVAFSDQIYTRGTIEYKEEHYFTDLLTLPGHTDGSFEWVRIPGYGDTKDYAELVTDTENKVEGKIAIVDRGEINFSVKISLAQSRGAIAVGIIDNDPSATDFNFNMDLGGFEPNIPVISILFRDKIVFDNATDFTCQLYNEVIEVNPTARNIADSSSDGPVFDLAMKPDITTPGDGVFGAVYAEGPDSYEYYSGTSMATPNYAGVYSLMLSEHLDDANWKAELTDRLMSSAKPIKDKYGTNFEAIRKQGAGLVDVKAALNTNVILDGSNDKDNLLGKAKVELKNNDQIKNGIVDLNFVTINKTAAPITYNASLYVYRPKLGKIDSERYGEKFENADLMSNNLELIEKVDSTLTVNAGNNNAHVQYSLSDETKTFLDSKFAYGTYIEGFLALKADGQQDLSIPYLGFYGDYSSGIPVEPFKFERNADLVYPSDLLNSIIHNWAGKNGVDYGSDWVIGNWKDLSGIDLEDYIANDKVIRDLFDANSRTVVPACTNPYTGEYEGQDIYMGNNGFSNTMIIQQFVMRSVETNTITIKNKSTGETVLTDHMFDSFYGAFEDDEGNDIQWPLYKSFVDTTYWSAGYIAHRAYTHIPLYNYEYDEKTEKYILGDEYPEGEYEMKFSYEIAGGGTYEKKYTLHIDNSAPKVTSVTDLQKDGKDYLRIRYEELRMSYVAINGYRFQVEKDDQGYYVDIEKAAYSTNNKVFLRGYDFGSSYSNVLLRVNDANKITIASASLTNAYAFEDGFAQIDDKSFSLQFSFTKSKKATVLDEDLAVTINMSNFANIDLDKTISVALENGEAVTSNFDRETATLSFTINSKAKVIVSYELGEKVGPGGDSSAPIDQSGDSVNPGSSEGDNKPAKKGCGGSFIVASPIIGLLAVLGVCLIASKKRYLNK